MDPRETPHTPAADPMVVDAVNGVRDRFGAEGLRDLLAVARAELGRVEQAERDLAAIDQPGPAAAEPLSAADTQAWLAYTEAEPRGNGDDIR
jgi:hypothetical protein